MGRVIILVLALLVPQMAAARMYMCVDEATGATSFTDKACESATVREEITVNPINPGSKSLKQRRGKHKAWRSQVDARKTGTEYNIQRRGLYEGKATASTR